MNLAMIHGRIANSVLLYVIILCLWGFWRAIRKENLSSSYWGSLVIGEILILLQGALGFYMFVIGLEPDRGGMHILYGIVGALGIPAVYVFTKGNNDRRTMIIYAAIMLFNAGIFLRSIATG
jgi:heme A synthase